MAVNLWRPPPGYKASNGWRSSRAGRRYALHLKVPGGRCIQADGRSMPLSEARIWYREKLRRSEFVLRAV